MKGQTARALITFAFAAALLYMTSGFLVPLMIGAMIALLLHPLYDYLIERKNWGPGLTAALLTFGVTVLLILPATLLSIRGVRFAASRFEAWKDSPFFNGPGGDASLLESVTQIPLVSRAIAWTADILRMDQSDIIESIGGVLKGFGLRAADIATTILSSLPTIGVGLFLLILGMYFFLTDGHRIARFGRTNSVYPEEQTDEIAKKFKELCRSVLLASLVSGFVQTLIYVLAAAIGHVGNLGVVGFTVFLASFIPVVGGSPVTFGIATYYLLAGERTTGIILLVAAFLASVSDNFVRPIVLKGGANLHPLIAIVAVFGGLQVFGFSGVFLGPILAGMFFVFLEAQVQSRSSD